MTSGQFQSFPIEQVYVVREERQRKTIDEADIREKAASIAAVGLINPITIERDGRLRAGETRWLACKSLGWTSISVQFVDDLDETQLHLLELDENLKRKALSWQEECDAIDRYHELKTKLDPTWDQAATAEALGISAPVVSRKLLVNQELKKPGTKIRELKKFSEANSIVSRNKARQIASVLDDIAETPRESKHVPLLNEDFNTWAPQYDGPKFNFIHCDFPYGIDADNQQQGSNVLGMGSYADGLDTYRQLLSTLRSAMDNVVAESAHLIFWYSFRHHRITEEFLMDMGWNVNPFPLIWVKSDNVGLLPDPQRGPRRIYESAFFASRGDRKIVSPVANAISAPTTKKIHMSEKPVPVLRHFFRMTVDEYSTVLDPTAGSANAIRAALNMGAASTLGLERDPEFFNRAKEHFHDVD